MVQQTARSKARAKQAAARKLQEAVPLTAELVAADRKLRGVGKSLSKWSVNADTYALPEGRKYSFANLELDDLIASTPARQDKRKSQTPSPLSPKSSQPKSGRSSPTSPRSRKSGSASPSSPRAMRTAEDFDGFVDQGWEEERMELQPVLSTSTSFRKKVVVEDSDGGDPEVEPAKKKKYKKPGLDFDFDMLFQKDAHDVEGGGNSVLDSIVSLHLLQPTQSMEHGALTSRIDSVLKGNSSANFMKISRVHAEIQERIDKIVKQVDDVERLEEMQLAKPLSLPAIAGGGGDDEEMNMINTTRHAEVAMRMRQIRRVLQSLNWPGLHGDLRRWVRRSAQTEQTMREFLEQTKVHEREMTDTLQVPKQNAERSLANRELTMAQQMGRFHDQLTKMADHFTEKRAEKNKDLKETQAEKAAADSKAEQEREAANAADRSKIVKMLSRKVLDQERVIRQVDRTEAKMKFLDPEVATQEKPTSLSSASGSASTTPNTTKVDFTKPRPKKMKADSDEEAGAGGETLSAEEIDMFDDGRYGHLKRIYTRHAEKIVELTKTIEKSERELIQVQEQIGAKLDQDEKEEQQQSFGTKPSHGAAEKGRSSSRYQVPQAVQHKLALKREKAALCKYLNEVTCEDTPPALHTGALRGSARSTADGGGKPGVAAESTSPRSLGRGQPSAGPASNPVKEESDEREDEDEDDASGMKVLQNQVDELSDKTQAVMEEVNKKGAELGYDEFWSFDSLAYQLFFLVNPQKPLTDALITNVQFMLNKMHGTSVTKSHLEVALQSAKQTSEADAEARKKWFYDRTDFKPARWKDEFTKVAEMLTKQLGTISTIGKQPSLDEVSQHSKSGGLGAPPRYGSRKREARSDTKEEEAPAVDPRESLNAALDEFDVMTSTLQEFDKAIKDVDCEEQRIREELPRLQEERDTWAARTEQVGKILEKQDIIVDLEKKLAELKQRLGTKGGVVARSASHLSEVDSTRDASKSRAVRAGAQGKGQEASAGAADNEQAHDQAPVGRGKRGARAGQGESRDEGRRWTLSKEDQEADHSLGEGKAGHATSSQRGARRQGNDSNHRHEHQSSDDSHRDGVEPDGNRRRRRPDHEQDDRGHPISGRGGEGGRHAGAEGVPHESDSEWRRNTSGTDTNTTQSSGPGGWAGQSPVMTADTRRRDGEHATMGKPPSRGHIDQDGEHSPHDDDSHSQRHHRHKDGERRHHKHKDGERSARDGDSHSKRRHKHEDGERSAHDGDSHSQRRHHSGGGDRVKHEDTSRENRHRHRSEGHHSPQGQSSRDLRHQPDDNQNSTQESYRPGERSPRGHHHSRGHHRHHSSESRSRHHSSESRSRESKHEKPESMENKHESVAGPAKKPVDASSIQKAADKTDSGSEYSSSSYSSASYSSSHSDVGSPRAERGPEEKMTTSVSTIRTGSAKSKTRPTKEKKATASKAPPDIATVVKQTEQSNAVLRKRREAKFAAFKRTLVKLGMHKEAEQVGAPEVASEKHARFEKELQEQRDALKNLNRMVNFWEQRIEQREDKMLEQVSKLEEEFGPNWQLAEDEHEHDSSGLSDSEEEIVVEKKGDTRKKITGPAVQTASFVLSDPNADPFVQMNALPLLLRKNQSGPQARGSTVVQQNEQRASMVQAASLVNQILAKAKGEKIQELASQNFMFAGGQQVMPKERKGVAALAGAYQKSARNATNSGPTGPQLGADLLGDQSASVSSGFRRGESKKRPGNTRESEVRSAASSFHSSQWSDFTGQSQLGTSSLGGGQSAASSIYTVNEQQAVQDSDMNVGSVLDQLRASGSSNLVPKSAQGQRPGSGVKSGRPLSSQPAAGAGTFVGLTPEGVSGVVPGQCPAQMGETSGSFASATSSGGRPARQLITEDSDLPMDDVPQQQSMPDRSAKGGKSRWQAARRKSSSMNSLLKSSSKADGRSSSTQKPAGYVDKQDRFVVVQFLDHLTKNGEGDVVEQKAREVLEHLDYRASCKRELSVEDEPTSRRGSKDRSVHTVNEEGKRQLVEFLAKVATAKDKEPEERKGSKRKSSKESSQGESEPGDFEASKSIKDRAGVLLHMLSQRSGLADQISADDAAAANAEERQRRTGQLKKPRGRQGDARSESFDGAVQPSGRSTSKSLPSSRSLSQRSPTSTHQSEEVDDNQAIEAGPSAMRYQHGGRSSSKKDKSVRIHDLESMFGEMTSEEYIAWKHREIRERLSASEDPQPQRQSVVGNAPWFGNADAEAIRPEAGPEASAMHKLFQFMHQNLPLPAPPPELPRQPKERRRKTTKGSFPAENPMKVSGNTKPDMVDALGVPAPRKNQTRADLAMEKLQRKLKQRELSDSDEDRDMPDTAANARARRQAAFKRQFGKRNSGLLTELWQTRRKLKTGGEIEDKNTQKFMSLMDEMDGKGFHHHSTLNELDVDIEDDDDNDDEYHSMFDSSGRRRTVNISKEMFQGLENGSQQHGLTLLAAFRKQLAKKFTCLRQAFKAMAALSTQRGGQLKLTKLAFLQTVVNMGFTTEDADIIWAFIASVPVPGKEFVEVSREINGRDFAGGLRYAAPVKDLVHLRERFVAKYQTVRRAFETFDKDRSGHLDFNEFCSLCMTVGCTACLAKKHFLKIVEHNAIEFEGTPIVTVDAFVLGLTHAEALDVIQRLRNQVKTNWKAPDEAFARLDPGFFSGPLDLKDFRRAVAGLGVSSRDAKHLFELAKPDMQGRVMLEDTVLRVLGGLGVHYKRLVDAMKGQYGDTRGHHHYRGDDPYHSDPESRGLSQRHGHSLVSHINMQPSGLSRSLSDSTFSKQKRRLLMSPKRKLMERDAGVINAKRAVCENFARRNPRGHSPVEMVFPGRSSPKASYRPPETSRSPARSRQPSKSRQPPKPKADALTIGFEMGETLRKPESPKRGRRRSSLRNSITSDREPVTERTSLDLSPGLPGVGTGWPAPAPRTPGSPRHEPRKGSPAKGQRSRTRSPSSPRSPGSPRSADSPGSPRSPRSRTGSAGRSLRASKAQSDRSRSNSRRRDRGSQAKQQAFPVGNLENASRSERRQMIALQKSVARAFSDDLTKKKASSEVETARVDPVLEAKTKEKAEIKRYNRDMRARVNADAEGALPNGEATPRSQARGTDTAVALPRLNLLANVPSTWRHPVDPRGTAQSARGHTPRSGRGQTPRSRGEAAQSARDHATDIGEGGMSGRVQLPGITNAAETEEDKLRRIEEWRKQLPKHRAVARNLRAAVPGVEAGPLDSALLASIRQDLVGDSSPRQDRSPRREGKQTLSWLTQHNPRSTKSLLT